MFVLNATKTIPLLLLYINFLYIYIIKKINIYNKCYKKIY